MRLAYLVAVCLPILSQASGGQTPAGQAPAGQAPDVSHVTKAPGDSVTLEISAESQPGKAPIALTWEVVFPAQLMEMEGGVPEIASKVKDAGKSLECTARTPYAYVCVLSGGRNPIENGTIAIHHFRIRAKARAAITSVKIEKAESTTADSRKWTLNNTEAIVIIH